MITLPTKLIVPNKVAPRSVDRDRQGYARLMESIHREGVKVAITVRYDGDTGLYPIVDGLHRWQACVDLKIEQMPCTVVVLNDEEVLYEQIRPSQQYVVIRPYEYSRQLKRVLAMDPSLTMQDLATKLGRTTEWVAKRLSLTRITDEKVIELINTGEINLTNAYGLARLPKHVLKYWVPDAKTLDPKDFMPKVHAYMRKLTREKRRRRLERQAVVSESEKSANMVKGIFPSNGEPILYANRWGPRIERKGWDNITVDGNPAYVKGSIAVYAISPVKWSIAHPVLETLHNETFATAEEAMEIVEKWLKID